MRGVLGGAGAAARCARARKGTVTSCRLPPGSNGQLNGALPDGDGTHRDRPVAAPGAGTGRWYDLTVLSDHDAAFERRFAGHVENGRPGVSDPAIATA